jgi:transcriptional regulator with XRE-family HTH domain
MEPISSTMSGRREKASEVAKQLGQRVRDLRKRLSFTQEELAERANISVSFLSMIERAYRLPHVETLVMLADALGVSLAEIFAGVSATKASQPTLLPVIQHVDQAPLEDCDVEALLGDRESPVQAHRADRV